MQQMYKTPRNARERLEASIPPLSTPVFHAMQPPAPSHPSTPAAAGSTAGIDLAQKLAQFSEHWAPRTVAEFNGHDVMVAKICGEYQWHVHADTDDFFLVLQGTVEIDLPGGTTVTLQPGQLYVVPRGVQHRPRASAEAHILLIESTGTPNSGDAATAAPRRVL
jgi:mannose-6-phosphate isomerase-like protein (cupin superfamily)